MALMIEGVALMIEGVALMIESDGVHMNSVLDEWRHIRVSKGRDGANLRPEATVQGVARVTVEGNDHYDSVLYRYRTHQVSRCQLSRYLEEGSESRNHTQWFQRSSLATE